jgi:tetratricopeptide (TPR) repeat protein
MHPAPESFFPAPQPTRKTRRVGFRQLNQRARVVLAAVLVGCASPLPDAWQGPPRPEIAPEARAAAAFMFGRSLELEGRLPEAARAYEQALLDDPDSAALHRYAAQAYSRLGEDEQALAHGLRALELQPEEDQTLLALVRLYISLQRADEALALLSQRDESGEVPTDGLFALFNLYTESGRFPEAEAVARRIIDRDPSDVRAQLVLAVIQERQNLLAEAEQTYRVALELDDRDPRALDAIARLRRRAGDVEGEVAVLREKLELFEHDVGALQRLAQIYDQAGDRDAAIDALTTLVFHHPEQLSAQFQLGFFHYEAGDHEKAIERLETAAASSTVLGDPRFLNEVLYFLGRAYRAQGDTQTAISTLERIPSSAERFPDARILMARVHERAERYGDAITDARRAVAGMRGPGEATLAIQVYLAGLIQRNGDLPGALALMDELIAQNQDNADLFYDLGLIYSNAGEEEKAVETMLAVLEREADHASALNYVGYTWADQGLRLEEAERMVLRAAELRPGDGYIVDSVGWVFYQKGLQQLGLGEVERARESFALAIAELERAVDLLDKEDPTITRHLGDAYRSVSRFEDAVAAYERALKLDPSPEDASEIQQQIDLLKMQTNRGAQR